MERFVLINMNGRMYDPVVGRYLGVDPVIQAPEFSQNYNGYRNCVNNPLKYSDQSRFEAEVITIAPEYYKKFIAQVCCGLDLAGLSELYKELEFETIQSYLDYLTSTYASAVGNGGWLFSNENTAYNYMWLSSKVPRQNEPNGVEFGAWITTKGVFVLPIEGYNYAGTQRYKNTNSRSRYEYYEYRWEDNKKSHLWGLNNRFYLLDPRCMGELEIIGHIHVHTLGDPDFYGLGFSGAPENGDDSFAKWLRGIPIFLIDDDERVYGEYWTGSGLSEINEVKNWSRKDLTPRLGSEKLIPIILKYQK